MVAPYNRSPDPSSDGFPVAPEVVVGGLVALAPHPAWIIITKDMIKTDKPWKKILLYPYQIVTAWLNIF